MFLTVIQDFVVNLIGKNDQLVLARQFDNLLQQFHRIQSAGGIVGIDDDDGTGVRVDLATDIVNVRIPIGLLITYVVNGFAAR